jgi:CheY-like chemotaxis protein
MKKHKILVVDDTVLNRILLVEILEEAGYLYVQASNGKQAIEIMEQQDFDLVLLDIEMPVMNGFDTIRHIRNKMSAPKNALPVIAITAHDPSMFSDDFKNLGFSSLLTKPYNIDKIKKMIQSFVK